MSSFALGQYAGRVGPVAAAPGQTAAAPDVRRAFILLLVFHTVLIGVRLRFGDLPLELFAVASLPAVYLALRKFIVLDEGRVDKFGLLVVLLMTMQVGWALIDIFRYGDPVVERIYLSFHRFLPLLVLFFICLYRNALLRAGAVDIVGKVVAFGLCLHAGVTIASAESREILDIVLAIGRFLDASSEQSVGGLASVYLTVEGMTLRTPGLLKYPTTNAGFIATAGALMLYFYYRDGRLRYLVLALLATAACVLTFSRAGVAAMGLGFLVLLLSSFSRPKIRVFAGVSVALTAAVMLAAAIYNYLPPAFVEAAWLRFSQFWELERFESMQLKLEATARFFDILVNDYYIFAYPGVGLNNFYLNSLGKVDFDINQFGMVSNGWLLFMLDMGLYYGLVIIVLSLCFVFRSLFLRNGLLIFILPFYFLVYVDNFYLTVPELHSLFWVLQGLILLVLTEEEAGPRRDRYAGAAVAPVRPVGREG